MRALNVYSWRLLFRASLVLFASALSACSGGGPPKVSLALSPTSVSETLTQGTSLTFSVNATVTGSLPSTAAVLVTDSGNAIEPDISLVAQEGNAYIAYIATLSTLPVGTTQGTLTVKLCSDQTCSNVLATASVSYTFTVNPVPTPTVSSISPSGATGGGNAFVLMVTGTNFVSNSLVQINGSARSTSYVSGTQLTAQVPAEDIAVPGTLSITVLNPGGGGDSNVVPLTVSPAPTPAISSLSPSSTAAGGASFTQTVSGTNFVAPSQVLVNGSARTTTYVSATQLTAQIAGTDISAPGALSITVLNPSPGGSSNAVILTANPIALPMISNLTPSSATAGGAAFTLMLTGTNFVANSRVLVNGSQRSTSYTSPTQLTAQITAADISAAGTLSISVSNPSPSGTGNTVSLTVNNPPPVLTQINANTAAAGCAAFNLYVIGSGFVNTSVVMWNGSPRTTTLVSTNVLAAQITAADVVQAGTAMVSVTTPAPGGGSTSALTFTTTASGIATTDAVAFQLNAQHSGSATTACPVSLPSSTLWTANLLSSATYALIADGLVVATVVNSSTNTTSLYGLSQSTGSFIWGPLSVGNIGSVDNTGPAYDAGSVFLVSLTGQAQSYNASTGALNWQTQLPNVIEVSSGVTAANGLVYTGAYVTSATGALYALNETTGAITWNAGVSNGFDSTPAVTADGVYVTYPCNVYDFVPTTGAPVWHYSGGCTAGGGVTSVVANGIVYSATNSSLTTNTQFDAETGAKLDNFPGTFTPAVGAQLGYFVTEIPSTLTAINNSTNATVWTFAGDGGLLTSPVVVNQTVFVGSISGNIYALDATTGTQLWVGTVPNGVGLGAGVHGAGGDYSVAPALAAGDGLLVVPSGKSLVTFRISSSQ
jgi:hypothetical protein